MCRNARQGCRSRLLISVAGGILALGGIASGEEKTILLVSDATSAARPPDSNDASLVMLLTEAGYRVDTRGMDARYREGATSPWAPGNEASLAAFEEADLVVVSRRTRSDAYDEDGRLWNELRKPLLLMSGYFTQGGDATRWGWQSAGSSPVSRRSATVVREPGLESHPFVADLPPSFSVVDLSGTPSSGELPGLFYLPAGNLPAAATVVLRMDGRPFLVEIPAGTDLDAAAGGPGSLGVTGALRVFLAAWGYDIDLLRDRHTPHQFVDFTTREYRCLLLNTIRELLGDPPLPCGDPPVPPRATRTIRSDLCSSREVEVTVDVTDLRGEATIIEVFPEDAEILAAPGGSVIGYALRFEIAGDAEGRTAIRYEMALRDRNHTLGGMITDLATGARRVDGDRRVPRCPEGVLGNVILVSDASDTAMGRNHDDSLVLLLERAGFSVDTSGMAGAFRDAAGAWDDLDGARLRALQAADLVVVSRDSVSGDYDEHARDWNELGKPLLLLSGYFLRDGVPGRWGWIEGDTVDLDPGACGLQVEPEAEAHPFVAGFVPAFPILDLSWTPTPGEIPKPFHLPDAETPKSGEVIARVDGHAFLLDIPKGLRLDTPTSRGGPYGETGERRVFLGAWGYDDLDQNGVPYQFVDHTTEAYRCLVVNVVRRMLALGPDPCVGPSPTSFRRADADGDGEVQLTDAIFVLGFLFLGGVPPGCDEAADADDDGRIQLTDPIRTLNYLFLGGPEPPLPGPESCGPDPPDSPGGFVGCESYGGC